jgi:hypothetical protein
MGSGKTTMSGRLAGDYDSVYHSDVGYVDKGTGKFVIPTGVEKRKAVNTRIQEILADHRKGKRVLLDGAPNAMVGGYAELLPHVDKVMHLDHGVLPTMHGIARRSLQRGSSPIQDLKFALSKRRETSESIRRIKAAVGKKRVSVIGRDYAGKEKTAERTAVIIHGNPQYVEGADKPQADRFYAQLARRLERSGYTVSHDAGAPYTSPRKADLWVGHSRGSDRLRFAGKGTTTIALGSPSAGSINHRKDRPAVGVAPTKEHYVLTRRMVAELRRRAAGTEKTAAARAWHGSPTQLEEVRPSQARGSNPFQGQNAVYAADTPEHAALYAVSKHLKGKANFAVMPDQVFIVGDAPLADGWVHELSGQGATKGHAVEDAGQLAIPTSEPLRPTKAWQVNAADYAGRVQRVASKEDLRNRLIAYKNSMAAKTLK